MTHEGDEGQSRAVVQAAQPTVDQRATTGAGTPAGASYDRRAPQTPARRRWSFWLAVAAASVVVAVVVARLMTQYGPADVRGTVLAFRVLNDTSVRVTVAVDRDPQRDAICLVRARNRTGAEVGHDEVRVPAEPGGAKRVRLSHVLTTTSRPVTGEAGRCLAVAPGAPLPVDETTVLPNAGRT